MTSLPSTTLHTTHGSTFSGILPPPDLRKIIDRTSALVTKSGPAIEAKLRERERANPKFCFLAEADAFHAYYIWRLGREKAGDSLIAPSSTVSDSAPGIEIKQNGQETEESSGPTPPPELHFHTLHPRLTALDLETIKLTALTSVQLGPAFVPLLRARESGKNAAFDFLTPGHSVNKFFNVLVLQYERILRPPAAPPSLESKEDVIASARQRAEFNRLQRDGEKQAAAEAERRRVEFASIDWADFHVVETIDFGPEDDLQRLPQPIARDDLLNVSLEQKRSAGVFAGSSAAAGKNGSDQQQQQQQQQQRESEKVPAEREVEMELDEEQDGQARDAVRNGQGKLEVPSQAQNIPANVKIRKDYQPKTMAQLNAPKVPMGISPAGQQVPLDQASKQVRVEGLDSRWKKQQEERDSKRASSQLIPQGATPFGSLRQLVNARPDLSGGSEAEIRRRQEVEEKERIQREREIKGWDGHADSRSATMAKYAASGEAIDEQIAVMHARLGLTGDEKAPIGPSITGTPSEPPRPLESHLPAKPRAFLDIGGNDAIIAQPATHSVPETRKEPAIHPSRLQAMNGGGAENAIGNITPEVAVTSTRSAQTMAPEENSEEPDAKRQKVMRSTDGMLLPEANWIMMHPYPITVQIRMPSTSEKLEWKYTGQLLEVPGVKLEYTVSTLRDLIGKHHEGSNAPNSRTKLTFNGSALKNSATLASLNLQEGDVIVMSVTAAKKK